MITVAEGTEGPMHPRHGWLAAVIPASGHRFRVADPDLAETLTAANAVLVDSQPDVEILAPHRLRPTAPWVVVNIDQALVAGQNDAIRVVERAPRRVAASLSAWAKARAVRRRLLHLGYGKVALIPWDLEQPLRLPREPEGEQSRIVERFPRSVLVLGVRQIGEQTTLESVIDETSRSCSSPVLARPLVRESGLVLVGSSAVLRVSVGHGAKAIASQAGHLKQLGRASSGHLVKRMPQIVDEGRTGLADWSLERRLPGRQPVYPLRSATLRGCLDFLVALHFVGNGGTETGPAEEARSVAAACATQDGAAIRRLGLRLESRLQALPRGFGHGDFWAGNLLIDASGSLTGVIDWEHAASAQLPLLDLLHLELHAERPVTPGRWGTAVAERLLPWARAGGSELARSYCERIGLKPTASLFVHLALAYWLNRLAFELGTYSDRRLRRRWMRNNVEHVLREGEALIG
jgi:hypothetical protein